MSALVSVIIPVYNSEKYIKKCIESILDQTYKNIEILVVNDGSKDESEKYIHLYLKKDSRIKYLTQDNQGVAAARNLAIQHAVGDYYLFVDSDDYIGPEYVADLVQCAEKNKSELVMCGYTLVYPEKNHQKKIIPGQYISKEKEEWAYRICAVCSRLYSSAFWNHNLLKFVSEPNARAEDVPIALYANAMAQNIQIIPKADYYYVQHKESAMNHKSRQEIFAFPYQSFEEMYRRIHSANMINGKNFFNIGVLKFLAQFEFVIYKKAKKDKKREFARYVSALLEDDMEQMNNEWKHMKQSIDFPVMHKIAITLFLAKYYKR